MANPITDPSLWDDYVTGNSPSSRWNGSAFEFLSYVFPENREAGLSYNGPGFDTAFPVRIRQLSGDPLILKVYPNGPSDPAQIPLTIGTPYILSFTPTTIAFTFFDNKDSGGGAGPYSLDVIVDAPVVVEDCKELGRTTKTYVTGYSLSRVNVARVRRMAKRCVVANFNGAIPKERSIVSVNWETTSPWAILMSNARIASSQRETMVDVTFNFSGWGGLLATVTLDNGEIYNAEFSFTVLDTPLYPSATYPVSNGPYILTANV